MDRPAEAQIYYNEAVRLDPCTKDCCWFPASVKFHLEQYDEAVNLLEVYTEDDVDNEWLHLLRAVSYGYLGKEIEGRAEIRRFNELRAKKGHSRPYTVKRISGWALQDEAAR